MYNPLLVTSSLSESLAAQLTRSAPSGGVKRKVPSAYNSSYNQVKVRMTLSVFAANFIFYSRLNFGFHLSHTLKSKEGSLALDKNFSALYNSNSMRTAKVLLPQMKAGILWRPVLYLQSGNDRNRGLPGFRSAAVPSRGRGVVASSYGQRWETSRSNSTLRKRPRFPDDTGGSFYSGASNQFPTNLWYQSQCYEKFYCQILQ